MQRRDARASNAAANAELGREAAFGTSAAPVRRARSRARRRRDLVLAASGHTLEQRDLEAPARVDRVDRGALVIERDRLARSAGGLLDPPSARRRGRSASPSVARASIERSASKCAGAATAAARGARHELASGVASTSDAGGAIASARPTDDRRTASREGKAERLAVGSDGLASATTSSGSGGAIIAVVAGRGARARRPASARHRRRRRGGDSRARARSPREQRRCRREPVHKRLPVAAGNATRATVMAMRPRPSRVRDDCSVCNPHVSRTGDILHLTDFAGSLGGDNCVRKLHCGTAVWRRAGKRRTGRAGTSFRCRSRL